MFDGVEELIIDGMVKQYFAGAVAYIEQDGTALYLKAFGFADRNAQVRRMKTDTLFDLASLTKVFTSTLVLRLVEERKLSLEDPISMWFEKLIPLGDIKIRQLLTHTSGFMAWYPFYTMEKHKDFIEALLEVMGDKEGKPGVRVEYSDLNYILLGKLVEKIGQAPLDQLMMEHLAKPLGMDQLYYKPDHPLKASIAATERGNQIEKMMVQQRGLRFDNWREDWICGEANDGNAFYSQGGISGHAGLFANAETLAKVARVYLDGSGDLFLSAELRREAVKNQTPFDPLGRGLGWVVGDYGLEGYGHTGFTGTSLWVVPEKRLTMILLTNRLHTQNPVNINDFRRDFYHRILNQWNTIHI